jgi:hypothetical protein
MAALGADREGAVELGVAGPGREGRAEGRAVDMREFEHIALGRPPQRLRIGSHTSEDGGGVHPEPVDE